MGIMGCLGKSNMHSQLFVNEVCDLRQTAHALVGLLWLLGAARVDTGQKLPLVANSVFAKPVGKAALRNVIRLIERTL